MYIYIHTHLGEKILEILGTVFKEREHRLNMRYDLNQQETINKAQSKGYRLQLRTMYKTQSDRVFEMLGESLETLSLHVVCILTWIKAKSPTHTTLKTKWVVYSLPHDF